MRRISSIGKPFTVFIWIGCLLYHESSAQTGVAFKNGVSIDTLPNVLVTGYNNGNTAIRASQVEKNAIHLVNAIAGETIEKSTDLTIADVAQRISGVSVTKNYLGLSDRILIRGIDPKYNYTLVNGLLIPSPDDRGRYISLSLFPSSMVQRVEVFKTLTADMEGGAIGGVVNIVMKDAPSKPLLNLQMSGGYNSIYFNRSSLRFDKNAVDKQSPSEIHGANYAATVNDFPNNNLDFKKTAALPDFSFGATAGKRYFKDRLGVIVSGNYQNQKNGSNNFVLLQNGDPQLNNQPNLTNYTNRRYDDLLTRIGLQNKWDYIFAAHKRLSFFQFYNRQVDNESRFSTDTNLVQGRSVPGTGRITHNERSRIHIQNLYSAHAEGEYAFTDQLLFKGTVAYAIAKGLYPDWSELAYSSTRLLQPDGSISQTPTILSPLTRTWLRNKEQDFSVSPHLQLRTNIRHTAFLFTTGAIYRRKWRSNFYDAYNFVPEITSSDGQPFIDIYHARWLNDQPQNPLGSPGSSNTFRSSEQVVAGYLQTSFSIQKFELTAGARLENTRQRIISSVDPLQSSGKEIAIRYSDLLPSIHISYNISPVMKLRAACFTAITRPALYDLSFYTVAYEDLVIVGNPFLKKASADNVDLRLDYSPTLTTNFKAGCFYKTIKNPFEKALLNANDALYPIPAQGLPYTPAGQLTEQLRNFGNAWLYGIELSGAHTFQHLTIAFNYTFTRSGIDQVKKFKTREIPGDNSSNIITVSKNERRPLQGQSPHNGNLNIGYKNDHLGFSAQLALVYTGKRIYSVSGWYQLDYWQAGILQSDFSLQQAIGKRWDVFANINNLFRNNAQVYINKQNTDWATHLLPGQTGPDRIRVQEERENPGFLVGVRFHVKKPVTN